MPESYIERVVAIFAGISAEDVDLAAKYIDQSRFMQHNPYAVDGVEGLKQFIREAPRDHLQLTVVRAFEDGPYVVTHATGHRSGRNVFFDVFRFEEGLVVEHWAFSAGNAPPNRSGHTQFDGPNEARSLEDTGKNKTFVRRYYETFHIGGEHSRPEQYFTGDIMVRHEPGVRDGVSEFLRDVEVLMQHRTIEEIRLLLGRATSCSLLPEEPMKATRVLTLISIALRTRRLWSTGAFRR